ncbi:MAG: pyridoxamine 5'-phosphate oxidase [Bacteroidia bacterium]|nr:pyridoxamine 5'-phosphate oxidase [Bacteroidia bacterium]
MDINYILSENTVDPDPFRQFGAWYKERLASVKLYPDALSLATSSKDGHVAVRTVLLKDYSDSGFIFFTNYKSKKGCHLTENNFAAMLFYWPESGRQVRIEGHVKKVPRKESELYFRTRPRISQIGAWASEQSTVIPDRKYLDSRVVLFSNKYSNRKVELPPHWGGFILVPDLIEFWQEGEFRLHDRIQYTRNENSWLIERLAP